MWSAIFLSSILFLALHGGRANAQDNCQSLETCRDCVRTKNCVWCKTEVHGNEEEASIRCVSQKYADQQANKWCSKEKIVNETTFEKIMKNDPLSFSKDKFVQIQPQVVNLRLRIGEEHRLILRYKQAEDYPVDLYFVTDLTFTMEKFKNVLSNLSKQIVTAMTSLTENFRLGFGSFIDKKLRPMVQDYRDWEGTSHYCFRNHLPLTKGHESFKKEVRHAKTVGNSDDPEGGFDGMMQAMVCKKEIGWRSDARHILVYASDNTPHIAGDGRFAGLPEPNDMQCHLNETGFYTHAELLDYPSIGQIRYIAIQNDVNIIFMVTERSKDLYGKIQSRIPGTMLGILALDSNNIIDLIKNYYQKLVKSLTVNDHPKLNFLQMKYHSKCLDGHLKQRNRCDGIRVNDTVEFEVVIKAMSCPEREEDWNQTIQIKPEGINEEMIVNLELICDCECSRKSNKGAKPPHARQCNNNGIIECGVCSCDQGHFGKMCQCKGDVDSSKNNASMTACRESDSAEICSGRGRCVCGSCDCGQVSSSEYSYYGKFCQCDNFSCRRSSDGKQCGGHGKCDCGTCVCHSGWGGPACECREDISQCTPANGKGEVCSNAGKCVCGRCMCDKKLGREGRFCEDCPSCPSQRCDEFKDCVECVVHKSGKIYQDDKECNQCLEKVELVDDIKEDPENLTNTGHHFCRIVGDDGSTFIFTYMYGNGDGSGNPSIVAKRDKDYRVITDFIAATFGVIFLTLLLGFLILLIWKICTHLHDKREFEKFDKEREKSKWGQEQNPLYSNPVTTFQNPTFDEILQQEEY